MRVLTQWLLRLRSLLRRRTVERELSDELRLHVDMETDAQIARGLPPDAARLAAWRALGGVEQIKEACRDARGTRPIADLAQDVRFGLRLLRRSPGFTAVAVLSLALGIGANTAIFTLVDAVLLRTLPVQRPHELVVLSHTGDGRPSVYDLEQVRALRAQREVLADLAAVRTATLRVTLAGESRSVPGQVVSGSYYALLGVRPRLGRLLTDGDDRVIGGHPVAVISDGYWRRQFGADPGIVGRPIDLDGRPFTIIGVTPPEFFGTDPGKAVDITVPLSMRAAAGWRLPAHARWLRTIGRLAPGVPIETAQAKIALAWEQIARGPSGRASPDAKPLALLSGARGLSELRQQFSLALRVLMGTVALVLLLACANLASLLLARASARRHEIGLRLALGAGRVRLLRQALAESLLLAAIGGAAGVLLARWSVRLLIAMMARGTDALVLDLAPNPRTLGFTLAITVATGLLFGIVPALGAARVAPGPGLRGGAGTIAGGRTRWMPVMVAAQTALCLLLLSGAALFLRTLVNLRHADGGFRGEPVLFVNLRSGAPDVDAGARAIFRDLQARLQQVPGIASATLTMDTPAAGGMSWGEDLSVPGRAPEPRDARGVWINHVGPRFFETMGIPLIAGRDVRESDDERAPVVAIVGERLARHYFGDEDPIGRDVILSKKLTRIVGVARDVKYEGLRADAPEVLYRPYLQRPPGAANAKDWALGNLSIALRTTRETAAVRDTLRGVLREVSSGLEIARIVRLDDQVDATLVRERMVATLSAFFGALALLLACIGLYGTLASTVLRRTREIGVRLALGAPRGTIAWMVVRHALLPVMAGLALGLAAALAGGGLVKRLLFDLAPTDPVSHAGAAVVLLACATCAASLPARRAGRIDPMVALRGE